MTIEKLPVESAPITSRDQAEAAMGLVTGLTLEIQKAELDLNARLSAARAQKSAVEGLAARRAAHEARLELWAQKDRKNWGAAKCLELRQGTIGFKWTNRAVHFLKGWTEELALAAIKKVKWARQRLIRTKEELHKVNVLDLSRPELANDDTLKAGERLTPAELKAFGLEVGKVENFYVEPRLDLVTP